MRKLTFRPRLKPRPGAPARSVNISPLNPTLDELMNIIANKDTDMHFLLNEIELKEAETKEVKNEFIHLARRTGQYTTLQTQLSDKEIDTIFKNAKFKNPRAISTQSNPKKTSHPKTPDHQLSPPKLDSIEEIPSQEVTVTGRQGSPSNTVEMGSMDGE